MKIDIKHLFTGAILFSHVADVNSTSITLIEAVKSGTDLSGANLFGANLFGANLFGANLSRANLSGADLSRATLSGADLSRANLSGADLSRANLSGANLFGANLSGTTLFGANLSGTDLSGANLFGANLFGANLSHTNLSRANLSRANLSGANLQEAKNFTFSLVPDEGAFTGWKKLRDGVVAKLQIPAEAKRNSTPTGRKNRAEFVLVLELFGAQVGISMHDGKTEYRVGEIVKPDSYNGDIRQECTNGIHFFITRAEAEAYQ